MAIATYDRPECMSRRLEECCNYLNVFNEIVICDNSEKSDQAILDKANQALNIKYLKNAANIGGGANFLRLIENSSSDYVWLRGDDDRINPSSVESVISNLDKAPKLYLLNSSIKHKVVGKGIDEFISSFDLIQSFGWISMVVVPTALAKRSLRWGYSGIGSSFAHVALILGMFRECPDLEFVVVPFEINDGDFRDSDSEQSDMWAVFSTMLIKFPKTSEVLPNLRLRKKYLYFWRKSLSWRSYLRLMARLKVGISQPEELNWSTFSSLRSVRNVRITSLAIVLWLMSKLPTRLYVSLFSVYYLRLEENERKKLKLDFLAGCTSFFEVYKCLSERIKLALKSSDSVGFI